MYRSIEITEIIGSVYVEGHNKDSISVDEVKTIMSKIYQRNQFISVRMSRKAMNRALSLANQASLSENRINIPNNNIIRTRFVREYYKLDVDTRSIISDIVKAFMQDGKI